MIEAIDEGNRLVTIGSSGLSDFEQSQMIIARHAFWLADSSD